VLRSAFKRCYLGKCRIKVQQIFPFFLLSTERLGAADPKLYSNILKQIFPSTPIFLYLSEWHIPDVVLIQLILLMMSTRCSKHVENWNKHIRKKKCASSWSFTRTSTSCCKISEVTWVRNFIFVTAICSFNQQLSG
jgi:hypothetical protein